MVENARSAISLDHPGQSYIPVSRLDGLVDEIDAVLRECDYIGPYKRVNTIIDRELAARKARTS